MVRLRPRWSIIRVKRLFSQDGLLGLSNLTVIRDTLNNIEANGKTRIDHTKIPLDDRATYDLLSRGDTLGVFQLDSDGMRSLLKTLKPK